MRERLLAITEALLRHPTAPFREHRVRGHIKAFCSERGLAVREDDMGNVLATYGEGLDGPLLAFEAHMDHPGFIIDTVEGPKATALFYGGVNNEYFADSPVRIFSADREVAGRVVTVRADPAPRATRATLQLDGEVSPGDLGMWDLVPFEVRDGLLHSRACDDLVGCAAILAVVDELVRQRIERPVLCVFTVAEEAGLNGAKYLCTTGAIPRNAHVIAIETSRELRHARIRGGAIIRVGDRQSVFAPAMTAFMVHVAEALRSGLDGFRYQRKLMDGGTCESTVYQAHGYTTGAACLALGNYHNRNFLVQRIEPEYVSVNDLVNLVRLFVGLVQCPLQLPEFTGPPPPAYREHRGSHGEWLLS